MQGLDGKTVLVTGASGFIGSALLPLLAGHARETVCLGRQAPVPPAGPGTRHVACDILDAASLAAAFGTARPDIVIHLAGTSVPPRDAAARRAMLDLNVMGTEAVLAAAEKAGAGLVVVVGSAAQYGPLMAGRQGLREDDPCRPSGLYGISKAAAGALALDLGLATGLPVALAVPFNVIGPGQAAHLVPSAFIGQMVAAPGTGPLRIEVGDVTAQRDWVDVRDVARAIALLAALRQPGAFNICTGRAMPVATLIETLREVSARPLDWTVDAARLRPDQPSVQFGDPSRIAAATGWRAEIGLAATLADMLREAGGQVQGAERRIA
jgi:GDP-4-dehydro-6-deoxy-D-mannose reductase